MIKVDMSDTRIVAAGGLTSPCRQDTASGS
jgi:hypothetical protein